MASRADELAAKNADLAELKSLVGRIPPNFSDWSYSRTVDFKEAAAEGAAALRNQRSSAERIRNALVQLRKYW